MDSSVTMMVDVDLCQLQEELAKSCSPRDLMDFINGVASNMDPDVESKFWILAAKEINKKLED